MKKFLSYLIVSAFMATGGLAFYSCDDDDYKPTPLPLPKAGQKTIQVNVFDQNLETVHASVIFTNNGVEQAPLAVDGSYLLDVSEISSNTIFTFRASEEGYISLKTESTTLIYERIEDTYHVTVALYMAKKGDPITIDPAMDTSFGLPSISSQGQIMVTIPAGSIDMLTTIRPTVIPTAAFRGQVEAETPSNSFALQILDLESPWTSNLLNGKMITVTFPLAQGVLDLVANSGLNLVAGSGDGSWESYPVVVNAETQTGTISVPRFATWYVAPDITVAQVVEQTSLETLGTGNCGADLTVIFEKQNPTIPEFYEKLLGFTFDPPAVNMSKTEIGMSDYAWQISGMCVQKTLIISGLNVPSYTYFTEPVTFSTMTTSCTY